MVPAAGGRLLLAEAKASRTPTPAMAVPMQRLLAAIGDRVATAAVVHRPDARSARTPALAPGVSAVDLPGLLAAIAPKPARRRPTAR